MGGGKVGGHDYIRVKYYRKDRQRSSNLMYIQSSTVKQYCLTEGEGY